MIDPFTAWSRMVTAGLDMQATWLRGLETLQASQAVISARTDKMRIAAGSPGHADIAELSRMIPEKVDAFSRSARSATRDAMAIHGAWMTQMRRFGAIMLSGRAPTIAEASIYATQTVDYALDAMAAGVRLGSGALAPVHHTATTNARRLNRPSSK